MSDLMVFVLFAATGALFYRWRGMDANSVPLLVRHRWTRRLLFAGLLGLAAIWPGTEWWALLAIPLSLPGVIAGHGSYQDRGTVERPDNEWFRKPLDWVFGPEPPYSYWRDFTGMAMTGLLITLPIAFLPGVAWWYAGVGVLKAVGYALPWKRVNVGWTEGGEMAWGAASVGLLALA